MATHTLSLYGDPYSLGWRLISPHTDSLCVATFGSWNCPLKLFAHGRVRPESVSPSLCQSVSPFLCPMAHGLVCRSLLPYALALINLSVRLSFPGSSAFQSVSPSLAHRLVIPSPVPYALDCVLVVASL